ncbi:MAG: sugar-binding transcriptional regulator [Anaerobutyricum hallii]
MSRSKLSDAPVAVQEDVCRAAAKDLSSYLNDGSIIGTAWGRTMKSFANYVSDLGVHNVKVVQINGKTNETSVPVGADDLSQAIARAGHGEAYVIPAPVAVDSAEIAEMLKKERNISAALTLARECQIALFGVGNLSRNTILYRSGSLKEEDFIELEEKGAVGDVCTCFFDARGEAVSSSFAKRRISITLEELKKNSM